MTLIELMLSLILTGLILNSVSVIYLATMKNHAAEAAMQTIQQNSQVTFELLTQAVHSAGHVGCAKLNNALNLIADPKNKIMLANRIEAYQGAEVKAGTNAFTVRQASPITNSLIAAMSTDNKLHVSASPRFAVGDVLFISDCQHKEIFTVQALLLANDQTQYIVADRNLSHRYNESAEVSQYEINTYYIAKTSRKDINGREINALYLKNRKGYKTELVEGVDSMLIRYAVIEGEMLETDSSNMKDATSVVGVSFEIGFNSLTHFFVSKKEYRYVALRE
jgi:Tfp pilus assembly protein PilW